MKTQNLTIFFLWGLVYLLLAMLKHGTLSAVLNFPSGTLKHVLRTLAKFVQKFAI